MQTIMNVSLKAMSPKQRFLQPSSGSNNSIKITQNINNQLCQIHIDLFCLYSMTPIISLQYIKDEELEKLAQLFCQIETTEQRNQILVAITQDPKNQNDEAMSKLVEISNKVQQIRERKFNQRIQNN